VDWGGVCKQAIHVGEMSLHNATSTTLAATSMEWASSRVGKILERTGRTPPGAIFNSWLAYDKAAVAVPAL